MKIRRAAGQPGLKGRVRRVWYGHSLKINLGRYNSTEFQLGLEMELEEGEDVQAVAQRLSDEVHARLDEIADARLTVIRDKLGLNE